MGELLWHLVKLYGFHRVDAALRHLAAPAERPASAPAGGSLRVELVSGVPDEGFELIERDNEVYAWDEPGGLNF